VAASTPWERGDLRKDCFTSCRVAACGLRVAASTSTQLCPPGPGLISHLRSSPMLRLRSPFALVRLDSNTGGNDLNPNAGVSAHVSPPQIKIVK
jgi:hypothetical protein